MASQTRHCGKAENVTAADDGFHHGVLDVLLSLLCGCNVFLAQVKAKSDGDGAPVEVSQLCTNKDH